MLGTLLLAPRNQAKIGIKYEFVDMGLSVDWCTCNIGAKSPEEYGWYFMWGGTIAYNSDRTPVEGGDAIEFNYNSKCPYWVSGTSNYNTKWSKYTLDKSESSTGRADNKLILEPEDDAAHVHLGGDCRMPTGAEFQELIKACDHIWVTNYNGSGINGRLFTLKSDQSKTLFFPNSGSLINSETNSGCYYWSSSLGNIDSNGGRYLDLYYNDCSTNNGWRYVGYPIRPVRPKQEIGGGITNSSKVLAPGYYAFIGEYKPSEHNEWCKFLNPLVEITEDNKLKLLVKEFKFVEDASAYGDFVVVNYYNYNAGEITINGTDDGPDAKTLVGLLIQLLVDKLLDNGYHIDNNVDKNSYVMCPEPPTKYELINIA